MDNDAMEQKNDDQIITFSEVEANEIRKKVKQIQEEVEAELNNSRKKKEKETNGRSRW